jgi:hypothetical protein
MWFIGTKFRVFLHEGFYYGGYMELSVGWTRTCSLDSVFTKYLSGPMKLSKSISGSILATPDMNIGGGLLLPCFAESFSAASSVSVPNRFAFVMVSPNH